MWKRRGVKIAVAACLLAGGLFLAHRLLLPSVVAPQGDGRFQDISFFAGPFPIRGYSVSMPEFDLSTPFEAEYHVSGLSNIGQDCGVFLRFDDHGRGSWSDTKKVGGQLHLDVMDSQGRAVADASGRLGDFIWWESQNHHGLYQMKSSFFAPDPSEKYRVRVSYDPDPRLAGFRGFVYLESGGYK